MSEQQVFSVFLFLPLFSVGLRSDRCVSVTLEGPPQGLPRLGKQVNLRDK